jgi:N-acyl homoserine lactone hydrolase
MYAAHIVTNEHRRRHFMRRVHVLPCGYEEVDKGILTFMKDYGRILKVPYHAYLIEAEDSIILVDTGSSVRWKELHPPSLLSQFPIHIEEHEHLDKLLKSIGFATDDVNYVINTHLHYDHCGNNEMFPKASFLVNEAELAHALAPDWWEAPGYVRAVFDDRKIRYDTISGEFEVVPGVEIISTPGHTEGHQSVVVKLEKTGILVLTGDAIYIRENLEGPILPGLYVDARSYAQSVRKLKHLTDLHKGTMLLSHSREFLSPQGWKSMKQGIQTFE